MYQFQNKVFLENSFVQKHYIQIHTQCVLHIHTYKDKHTIFPLRSTDVTDI